MIRLFQALRLATLFLLTAATLACTPSPPTITTYEKDGVSFEHLSDWKVTEDTTRTDGTELRFINLEGPYGSTVMLTMMPSPVDQTLEEYASLIAHRRSAAIAGYSIGPIQVGTMDAPESQVISGRVGGMDQTGIAQKFVVTALGQAVPHEAHFFQLAGEETTAFIVTQVSSDVVKHVAPAISATLDSLRIGIAQ